GLFRRDGCSPQVQGHAGEKGLPPVAWGTHACHPRWGGKRTTEAQRTQSKENTEEKQKEESVAEFSFLLFLCPSSFFSVLSSLCVLCASVVRLFTARPLRPRRGSAPVRRRRRRPRR